MHSALFISFLVLVVAVKFGVNPELVRTKCSLARELHAYGIPMEELPDWLCIARYASNYIGDIIGPFSSSSGGSRSYGVFRVSNEWWCASNDRASHNLCNVTCEQIISDDIKYAIDCAQIIKNDRGFNAWDQWKNNCQGDKPKPTYEECFVYQRVCIYDHKASSALRSKA